MSDKPNTTPCSLLPCPFCASAPKDEGRYNGPHVVDLGRVFDHEGEPWWNGYAVVCPFCEARGPKNTDCLAAISEWNDREFYREND